MAARITVGSAEPLQPERPGVWRRVLLDEHSTAVVEWFFDAGVETKAHGHDLDQAAYHVSGKFELRLDSKTTTLVAGDAYFIPAGESHGLRCIEKGSYILTTLGAAGIHPSDMHPHANGHGHGDADGHDHDHGHRR